MLAAGVGLALFVTGAHPQSTDEIDPLRLGFPAGASAPFVAPDGSTGGGLHADLAALVAEAFGRPVRVLTLPANRLDSAVDAGEVDLRCHAHPDSVRQPEAYAWSAALWSAPEVLVGPASSRPLEQLSALRAGQVVATVLHRQYPTLDAHFGTGNWRRDDAPSTHRALSKMALGRGHYAVSSLWELHTFSEAFPQVQLAPWRLYLGPNWLHCGVPRNGRLDAAEGVRRLNRLRDEGRLEALLQRYQMPTVAVVAGGRSPWAALTREQLEPFLLGQARSANTRPRLLAVGETALAAFAEQALDRSETQLRADWNAAPGAVGRRLVVLKSEQVKHWLHLNPQAIGVLPLQDLDPSLRLLYVP